MTDAEVIAGLPEPDENYVPMLPPPRLSVLRDIDAFAAIIDCADTAYLKVNGRKCPWSPRSLQLLKQMLDQHHGIPPTRWKQAVARWYAKSANRPLAPSELVTKLHFYINGNSH